MMIKSQPRKVFIYLYAIYYTGKVYIYIDICMFTYIWVLKVLMQIVCKRSYNSITDEKKWFKDWNTSWKKIYRWSKSVRNIDHHYLL